MKVALLANLKHNAPTWPGMPLTQWDHLATWTTIDALTTALEQAGHQVIFLEGDETLYNNLQAVKPDICFNICQGHFETYVPGILEMLRLPYTGSQTFTLALDRLTLKHFLIQHGLPTPTFVVVEHPAELPSLDLQFPLFVKPIWDGLPQEARQAVLMSDRHQFEAYTHQLLTTYHQPVLAEKFVEGREITIGIVGNLPSPTVRRLPPAWRSPAIWQGLHLLPPVERGSSVGIAGSSTQVYPAVLSEGQLNELKWLAAATFRVIGCLDVAQITFRLEAKEADKPYIVDIETFPRLYPEQAPLCQAAIAYGWPYEELITHILDEALERYHLKTKLEAKAKAALRQAQDPAKNEGYA